MRRTPYDRLEHSYQRMRQQRNSQLYNQSFKVEPVQVFNKDPQQPKPHLTYSNIRVNRGLFSQRPGTTNKNHSAIQHKREGSDPLLLGPQQKQKQLYISNRDEHHVKDPHHYQHSKGRLYRGSSWRYDEKIVKQIPAPTTTRYASGKPLPDFSSKGIQSKKHHRNTSAIMDLIGQNLKRSELSAKEDDFFEYILRFSYRTRKGYIPNNSGKVNQDSFIINPNINSKTWQHFFAVCDGHGPFGHHVSSFIKNKLPVQVAGIKNIQKHPKEGLNKAFQQTYQKLLKESNVDLNYSGSTIISCYLHQNKLYCANLGDSRAILGKQKHKKWRAQALSIDHKPTLQKEAERIRKMKGRVQAFKDENGQSLGPLRVWVKNDNVPGLAMTRSFGDLVGASVGVSPIPQITQFTLSQEDRIIVIGSDGVFQFLSNQEIITAMVPYYDSKQIQQASDHLLSMTHRSWTKNSSIIDDITFILIFISYNEL